MPLNGEERVSNCQLPVLSSCLPRPSPYGSKLAKRRLNPEGQGGWSSVVSRLLSVSGKSWSVGVPRGGALSYGAPTCPTENTPTGRVCVNKEFFFFCFSSTNKLRNKLENCPHPLQTLGMGSVPCPCRAKRVHSLLKSQSSPGPGWREEGSHDLLASSVLQLPQAARLSLGLIQALVLAGRGGV